MADINNKDIWIDVETLARLKNITRRAVRLSLNQNKYEYKVENIRGGKTYKIKLSTLEEELQLKYFQEYYDDYKTCDNEVIELSNLNIKQEKLISEKQRKIVLAKYDLIYAWLDFRKEYKRDKLKTGGNIPDKEFLQLYNTGMFQEEIFKILGKVSIGALYRWRALLDYNKDWTALVGYDIMHEECTQNIASALRNAILKMGHIPEYVYQDNGRAFKSKIFNGDKKFEELGFTGVYNKLGVKPVYATPYNARAKVIERFFLDFQESFEKLLPSYIGSSIQDKPAYMMRNEKFHKNFHNGFIPTIEETIKMIDMWLSFKNSQPCPNSSDKTIAEVLSERKRQNIDINTLNDLMLATEVKTIQRNGIKFLNCDYFDERLYGFKSKVLIKYNLFDLTNIKVYTPKGEYLCTAERVTETHPMAKLLGDVKDYEDYKQKIVRQHQLKKKTVESVKKYLKTEDIKLLETELETQNDLPPFKTNSKRVQTLFKNNSEKYEYLVANDPNNSWITEFKNTKEYRLLYE